MRKTIVAGNWKMNKTPKEGVELAKTLLATCNSDKTDVVFCTPYVDLYQVLEVVKGSNIKVAAQNMHFEDEGAYTGEISADMLVEMGVSYVVLGHSERREYFGETDETVNKKTIKALAKGLIPIVCFGESLEAREQNITIDLVRLQVKIALQNVSADDAKKVVLAYEPIWAIGTGKTATSEQAQEVCKAVREVVAEIYDQATADVVRIQYGGSVNGSNAKELFGMADIDGGLVGGASLKADFDQIVNY